MFRYPLLPLLALSACHAVAGYGPARPMEDARLSDGGLDTRIDASVDLQRYVDISSAPPAKACTASDLPEDAIWVQRFDAPSALPNSLPSVYPAQVGGPLRLFGKTFSRTSGPRGCGEALSYDTTWGNYGLVDDDLRLVEGTISIWVRFAGDGRLEGILSRDRANSREPGHLSLMRTVGGHIVLRLQTTDPDLINEPDLICSAHRAPSGLWHHIRVTFGGGQPPTLEVNGSHELLEGPLRMQGEMIWDCTLDPQVTHGIEGNSLPLAVGATLMFWSGSGTVYPKNYLQGAIDEIVISGKRVRR